MMANPNNLPFLREDFQVDRVGVQGTTLSLDVLGRFVCNTWDEATTNVLSPDIKESSAPFDAIVIGAGMYGAYCAQKIWRRGGKVLVLEAGPFLVSEHVQNLANIGLNAPPAVLPTDPAAGSARGQVWGIPWRGNQIFPGLAYCVGGKSLFWGGWSPRLTDDVLEDFPKGTRDYLNNNYQWVEVQLGVAQLAADGTVANRGTGFIDECGLTKSLRKRVAKAVDAIPTLEGPHDFAPVAVQGSSPSSGLFSFDKYSSGPILVDAIREDIGRSAGSDANRRLYLVPKCHVTKLNAAFGAVHDIDVFVDGTFKKLPIPESCQVILAMSCIESTRLALESFPTPLMGRNLMVHLRSNFVVRIPRSKFSDLAYGPVETAAVHVPGVSAKGGRFHLQIVGGANRNNNAEEIWFRTIPDTDVLRDILKNQDNDYVALQFRSIGEMFGVKDNGAPDQNISWIGLCSEKDEFGKRRAYVHLKTVGLDDELWDEMDEAGFTLAEALGQGETEFWVVDDKNNGRWSKQRPSAGKLTTEGNPRGPRDPLGTTYHECGTLWMGSDPSSSVTDSRGRFHHIRNSYCVDQATFTRSGSANPVPTGLGISRQAAEYVCPQPPGSLLPEPGFDSLFRFSKYEQRLPDGWQHSGGGGFQRLGEILETEGDGIGLLVYTAREYEDFVLKVQWRSFTIRNNSGVYVRLPQKSDGGFDARTGYEIQIDNIGNRPGDASSFPDEDFNEWHQTGAIYPVHVPRPSELPNGIPDPNGQPSKRIIPTAALGAWNEFEITVTGDSIRVILNGVDVLEGGDYRDRRNTYPKGFIALQNHFKGRRVQFRNVRIKPVN